MQELRFVGVENGAVIATNEDGERFRLVVDEGLREALRPRPTPRAVGPKVPPRVIQQLIRAGATVDMVVDRTGADRELVERFEGPILAERGYILEQARGVPVRVQQPLDPLAGEGATFGTAIDERLAQLEAGDIVWDAWRDPETGWHVGLDFVADQVGRNALWRFDAKTHTLEAVSPAAITLSQQGELPALGGPQLRAVDLHPTDAVIPVAERPRADDPFAAAETGRATTHETADLLEELRRRRGERSSAPYDEEAEFHDFDAVSRLIGVGDEAPTADERAAAPVTPFARPERSAASTAPGDAEPEDAPVLADGGPGEEAAGDRDAEAPLGPAARHDEHAETEADSADGDRPGTAAPAGDAPERAVAVPPAGMEPPAAAEPRASQARRRGGRPSMPSWDEIVFGTRTDDD